MHTVGIAGATGYSGQELVRLLARHPHVSLQTAMGSQKAAGGRTLPALSGLWNGEVEPYDFERLAANEVVFLALPEDASADIAPNLVARGRRVFDLSGAFRLRADGDRARWYHAVTSLPEGTAYGMTERTRAALPTARLIACAGCYPTAAVLALAPLVTAGLVAGDVIIDAKSGVSGAGKAPSERTHFCEVDESLSAYGVFAHRHAAEIEQELGVPVTFVPHLVPIDRGILETIYVRVAAGHDRRPHCRRVRVGLQPVAVCPAARRRSAGHQARRAHQLLRHRLEARCRHWPARRRVVPRQPVEGRRRSGGAELQRRLRVRRAAGPAVKAVSVLKFGGELLEPPERLAALASMLARVAERTRLAVVHGGGREIDAALARIGVPKRQVDGLRVTDEPTMGVVVEVLAGTVNTRFVAAITAAGGRAVGLTGADAGLAVVEKAAPHVAVDGQTVDLGLVGQPIGDGTPALLRDLVAAGYLPVVCSIGVGRDGTLFNVNADTLAGHLAGRLQVRQLVIAGATPGVLDSSGHTVAHLDRAGAEAMVQVRRRQRRHDRQAEGGDGGACRRGRGSRAGGRTRAADARVAS